MRPLLRAAADKNVEAHSTLAAEAPPPSGSSGGRVAASGRVGRGGGGGRARCVVCCCVCEISKVCEVEYGRAYACG
jgi:hypothetical protein